MSCLICSKSDRPYHLHLRAEGVNYCDCHPDVGEERDVDGFDDIRGNKVEVGDIIATALIIGRSANLAVFAVDRIYVKATSYGYRQWQPRLRVIPLDRNYGSVGDMNVAPEERKRSTLQFWERSVLLEKRGG